MKIIGIKDQTKIKKTQFCSTLKKCFTQYKIDPQEDYVCRLYDRISQLRKNKGVDLLDCFMQADPL